MERGIRGIVWNIVMIWVEISTGDRHPRGDERALVVDSACGKGQGSIPRYCSSRDNWQEGGWSDTSMPLHTLNQNQSRDVPRHLHFAQHHSTSPCER